MKLRKLIEDYLKEARLMQLATSIDKQPWVCSVWFAADEDLMQLILATIGDKNIIYEVKNESNEGTNITTAFFISFFFIEYLKKTPFFQERR